MQIAQLIAAAVSSSNFHHIFILSLMLNVPRPWMTHILYPQIFNIVVIVVLLKALDDTRPPFTIVSLFIESLLVCQRVKAFVRTQATDRFTQLHEIIQSYIYKALEKYIS